MAVSIRPMANQVPSAAELRIALLCRLCPNRRVLTHFTLWSSPDRAEAGLPPDYGVEPVETKQRWQRPSVEIRRPFDRQDPPRRYNPPRQWRCRKRHPWSFTEDQLRDAILAAIDAGRDEIVAGVDLR